jgi:hypothetical protein
MDGLVFVSAATSLVCAEAVGAGKLGLFRLSDAMTDETAGDGAAEFSATAGFSTGDAAGVARVGCSSQSER